MKAIESLDDLLFHEIQVLFNAEELIIAALPRMVKKASDKKLQEAFHLHLEESMVHRERLQQICRHFGIDPHGDGNPGIKGLIAESEKVMHKNVTPAALDAALIAGAQKIEHYEICGYGTAAHIARSRGFNYAADLLEQTLQEEKATDFKLNELAKGTINRKAQPDYVPA